MWAKDGIQLNRTIGSGDIKYLKTMLFQVKHTIPRQTKVSPKVIILMLDGIRKQIYLWSFCTAPGMGVRGIACRFLILSRFFLQKRWVWNDEQDERQ